MNIALDTNNLQIVPNPDTGVRDENQIAKRIDDFLIASGYNGGVLVAKNGKVILRNGYGWANEELKLPLSTKTVFDIGSVSKQFTGAAILKLEEQGKLNTDHSITKFFKGVPSDKQKITIHELLTHTSGLESDVVDRTDFFSRDESVRQILNSKLKKKPGEKYNYSNAGYALLAAIVEISSGLSYENYLNEFFWEPIGMNKTGMLIPRYTDMELARGYDDEDLGTSQEKFWNEAGPSWGVKGAGYILSTLEDLYLWHIAISGNSFLSNKSKERYFGSLVPENDKHTSYYGYGWASFTTNRGTKLIGHDGYNSIYFTNFQRFVDEDIVIISFTNHPNSISREIISSLEDVVFNAHVSESLPPKIKIPDAEVVNYTGMYELPSGINFKLEAIGGQLSVKAIGLTISKLLTTFPDAKENKPPPELETQVINLIENISKQNFQSAKKLLHYYDSFEEEKEYWKKTFDNWNVQYGAFQMVEIIGFVWENEDKYMYALLQFEKGAKILQCRSVENNRFFIGTRNSIIPMYYRLIPKSNKEFYIYNYTLKTITPLKFNFDENDKVIGMSIKDEIDGLFAKKQGSETLSGRE